MYDKQYKRKLEHRRMAYDTFELAVPKGERERIKEYALSKGESVNVLSNRLLAENIPDFKPISAKRGRKPKTKDS